MYVLTSVNVWFVKITNWSEGICAQSIPFPLDVVMAVPYEPPDLAAQFMLYGGRFVVPFVLC